MLFLKAVDRIFNLAQLTASRDVPSFRALNRLLFRLLHIGYAVWRSSVPVH